MSTSFRVGIILMIFAVSAVPPLAAAESCVEVDYMSFGDGLRIIANQGRQVAFGIISGDPGDGAGVVVFITPSACAGGAIVPTLDLDTASRQGSQDARALLSLLPLP